MVVGATATVDRRAVGRPLGLARQLDGRPLRPTHAARAGLAVGAAPCSRFPRAWCSARPPDSSENSKKKQKNPEISQVPTTYEVKH